MDSDQRSRDLTDKLDRLRQDRIRRSEEFSSGYAPCVDDPPEVAILRHAMFGAFNARSQYDRELPSKALVYNAIEHAISRSRSEAETRIAKRLAEGLKSLLGEDLAGDCAREIIGDDD